MCGIAGFLGSGGKSELISMIESLRHRGPDFQGEYYTEGVGLAHARLSILDLSQAGAQPMFTEEGDVSIVFNGEIYNFQELKKELPSKYRFRSGTDTEVILYLYKEYGEQCFKKLNGMFAIALYDAVAKKLILARDRLGKKPLYWGVWGCTVVFGSELKAVLKHSSATKEINLEALSAYLSHDCVPTPLSIYKNIYKHEPGAYSVFKAGTRELRYFWEPTYAPEISQPYQKAVGALHSLLDEAVKRRLVADVPIGVFLSGGLDSSAVAYYAKKNSEKKIKTFSIGFKEKSFDESGYAERVAGYLGTEHHVKIVDEHAVIEALPHIFNEMDEPFADASVLPTYVLSRFAREHVTVALGGDGGDELFFGYPTFQADTLFHFSRFLPSFFEEPAIRLAELAGGTKGYMSLGFKARKFFKGREDDALSRHRRWMETFSTEEHNLIIPALTGASAVSLLAAPRNVSEYYLRRYLMDQVLVKVDRSSMLHSLEVRAPLLDYTVVDFANHLPATYKYRYGTTKRIFKDVMKGKLPEEIIFRKKKGFAPPVLLWFRRGIIHFPDYKGTLLDIAVLERLKNEWKSGNNNDHKKFWNLFVLTNWLNRHEGKA